MEQLELFEGPEPIRKWLHVWNEAERAARIKKPGAEAQGEVPGDRVEERVEETPIQAASFWLNRSG